MSSAQKFTHPFSESEKIIIFKQNTKNSHIIHVIISCGLYVNIC